jgi:hypothetical protein
MRTIAIGPSGWGSVARKTAVESLGDVTINVNSRGGVEVIRKAGERDYRGWYAEEPDPAGPSSARWTVQEEGRTTKHEFNAAVADSGAVRVERREGSLTAIFEFDLTSEPNYRGETTRELEDGRKAFLRDR